MCFAQGHNGVSLVRLEPTTPQSQVKHSTTESLIDLPKQNMAHIPYGQGVIKHDLYRHVCIKFKDFLRTSKIKDSHSSQELQVYKKY